MFNFGRYIVSMSMSGPRTRLDKYFARFSNNHYGAVDEVDYTDDIKYARRFIFYWNADRTRKRLKRVTGRTHFVVQGIR